MSRETMPQPAAWPGASCAEMPAREAGAAAREGGKAVAGGHSRPAMQCPAEHEEDMYRAADEIEKEKELLIHERGASEPRLSVAPEMDIMDYCKKEWRGNTQKATCMKKLPEKLMSKYSWIKQWKLGLKFDGKSKDLVEKIKESLTLLRKKWASLAEMRTAEARQIACDELFTNEEEEYSLYEAVKFLMLNRAIELYDDKEKGKEVPFFSVLLFARDTSNDPGQLLRNHLNQVGHTGGLEQVSYASENKLPQAVGPLMVRYNLIVSIGWYSGAASLGLSLMLFRAPVLIGVRGSTSEVLGRKPQFLIDRRIQFLSICGSS
uniref:Ubiquitin thioesterase otulin isoform X3 n=1 Tax=Castor canadensis TaxID=51338 RepID=A0A8B7U6S4_CASCN|nr:ubiquitin thioesterase otulin isoform X3 [Castor canadensis]